MKKLLAAIRTLFSTIAKHRKLRSGAFSLALTSLVILICVLSGILGDLLEDKFALQMDLSFNGATTQSKVSTEQLQALDQDVHIYVLTSVGSADQTLLSLLTRYAAITDRVTFSQENIAANPMLLTKFESMLGKNQVSSDCVIVYCEKNNRARVINSHDFDVLEYSSVLGTYVTTGQNYDKALVESIVFVAQTEPLTLQLLRGHNELSGANLTTLETILTDANYRLTDVNLLNGDALQVEQPLLILCPQLDLSEKELALLIEFANQGGHFFIASNYSDPLDLERFNTLLRTYGVGFFSGLVMAKEEDRQSYYSDTPAFLMPRMMETELTLPLIENSQDVLLMPGSRALILPASTSGGLTVEPLIITGQAYIRDYVNVEPDSATQQPTDEEGYFALSVLSSRVSDSGNVSRAHIIGNSLMFTDSYIEENTYSAAYLLRTMAFLQGESPINLDISGKSLLRDPLTFGSLAPAVILIILLPLSVLFAALKVLLPRKHL